MQKEIRIVNKEKGIYQITTISERWYTKQDMDKTTGLPVYTFLPSVTWIAGYYPKGIAFYKWLADKGWDEAEAIKSAAGDKGSKVHQSCQDIELGQEIKLDEMYPNPTTGLLEELKLEEIDCIVSFRNWLLETTPELLATEMTVFGDGYAGTIDRIYRIGSQIWIVDFKTGQHIWEEGKIQLSGYSHADIDYKTLGITDQEWVNRKLAILQLGYWLNKKRYKFTEIEDKFDMFLVAQKIWANENPEAKPKQRDYPLILKYDAVRPMQKNQS